MTFSGMRAAAVALLVVLGWGWAHPPAHASNWSSRRGEAETPGREAPRKKTIRPVRVVDTWDDYAAGVRRRPGTELVRLSDAVPGIVIDLRYRTADNFVGRAVYPPDAEAYLARDAAERLARIQADLRKQGYGLKIWDAYRPHSATKALWASRKAPPNYVAPPILGSTHNRGIAVDCTLVELATGRELEMPTPYDSFKPQAASAYRNLPEKILRNRDLLKRAMQRHGFIVLTREWWHYNLPNESAYPVLDLEFSLLASPQQASR